VIFLLLGPYSISTFIILNLIEVGDLKARGDKCRLKCALGEVSYCTLKGTCLVSCISQFTLKKMRKKKILLIVQYSVQSLKYKIKSKEVAMEILCQGFPRLDVASFSPGGM